MALSSHRACQAQEQHERRGLDSEVASPLPGLATDVEEGTDTGLSVVLATLASELGEGRGRGPVHVACGGRRQLASGLQIPAFQSS